MWSLGEAKEQGAVQPLSCLYVYISMSCSRKDNKRSGQFVMSHPVLLNVSSLFSSFRPKIRKSRLVTCDSGDWIFLRIDTITGGEEELV